MPQADLQDYFDSMLAPGAPSAAVTKSETPSEPRPEIAERLAGAVSVPVPEAEAAPVGGPTLEWVVFRLGAQHYAVDVHAVREIVRPPTLVSVPHGPPTLVGMANLRGAVVAVFDAAALIDGGAVASSAAARIIVLEHRHDVVGLLVDSVGEILRFDGDRAEPPPRVGADAAHIKALLRQPERIVLQLDPDSLFG
jgi:purine-binding chemotaxis protein CheW